jgi:hypothetical protein
MIGSCRHQPLPSSLILIQGKQGKESLDDEELQARLTLILDNCSDAIVGGIKVTSLLSQ